MSRIDDLIAELCPAGVEFRALGDLIHLNFGARITKMHNSGTLYPVYGGGGESFRTDSFNRQDEYVVSRFAVSEVCVRRVRGKFWMLDSGFTFDPIDGAVLKDFVAYVLFSRQREIYACSSQGAQKNLKVPEFKKFRLPVPPVEIQRQVVRTLDSFTELGAALELELGRELQARRRQYEFYRDQLFAFGDKGTPWVPMSDVGEFIRGRRFTKDDLATDGIGSIHYGEIYTHYGTSATHPLSRVRADLASRLRFANPGDVVVAAVGETVEDVGKSVAWLGDGPVAVHDDCFIFRHSLDPKFVSYFFQTSALNAQKAKYVARAKVKRLSGHDLSKLTIPVPPREEQERVVQILDDFHALLDSLSSELPAELRARRQQYEYYRDRLLTFEEAAA